MNPATLPADLTTVHRRRCGMTIVDHLVAELTRARVHSIAFVVPSDVEMTMPLYDVAIATARRGWRVGIDDVRYWFVTPEHQPVNDAASEGLEPEGIVFIGSTYPDVRGGRVLLDPRGESIEVDLVVSLRRGGRFDLTPCGVSSARVGSPHELRTNSRPRESVRPAAVAA